MTKSNFGTVIYSLIRRFISVAITAILVFVSGNWQDWFSAAADGDATAAVWLPGIYLIVEAIQKGIRTYLSNRR